jgi:hypothetical protein
MRKVIYTALLLLVLGFSGVSYAQDPMPPDHKSDGPIVVPVPVPVPGPPGVPGESGQPGEEGPAGKDAPYLFIDPQMAILVGLGILAVVIVAIVATSRKE